MKHLVILIFLLVFAVHAHAQILLENKEGDGQFVPLISITDSIKKNNSALIKLNTSDQSIGFDYFSICNNQNRVKYKFWGIGLKSKPTDGYASVIKNNQFNPGVTIDGSITKVKIFDREATKPDNGFLDWGALYVNYSVNKYLLLNEDTAFNNQLYSKTFQGLGVGINYNILIKSTHLISLKFGYARKNNYTDLDEVEVKEIRSYYDSLSNTTRQVSSTKSARLGDYSEFDAFPLNVSLTKLTSDDPGIKNFTFGYNIYAGTQFRSKVKSIVKAGCILFLAKNKDGISTPFLGLNFQFDDFFDVKGVNNGLLSRLSIGLTSSFSF